MRKLTLTAMAAGLILTGMALSASAQDQHPGVAGLHALIKDAASPGVNAASVCGCRVGAISCQNHVTYECQDIRGCTMWILKGGKC